MEPVRPQAMVLREIRRPRPVRRWTPCAPPQPGRPTGARMETTLHRLQGLQRRPPRPRPLPGDGSLHGGDVQAVVAAARDKGQGTRDKIIHLSLVPCPLSLSTPFSTN